MESQWYLFTNNLWNQPSAAVSLEGQCGLAAVVSETEGYHLPSMGPSRATVQGS